MFRRFLGAGQAKRPAREGRRKPKKKKIASTLPGGPKKGGSGNAPHFEAGPPEGRRRGDAPPPPAGRGFLGASPPWPRNSRRGRRVQPGPASAVTLAAFAFSSLGGEGSRGTIRFVARLLRHLHPQSQARKTRRADLPATSSCRPLGGARARLVRPELGGLRV